MWGRRGFIRGREGSQYSVIKPATSVDNCKLIPLGSPGKRCPIHAPELLHLRSKGLEFSHAHSWKLWTVPRELLLHSDVEATAGAQCVQSPPERLEGWAWSS